MNNERAGHFVPIKLKAVGVVRSSNARYADRNSRRLNFGVAVFEKLAMNQQ